MTYGQAKSNFCFKAVYGWSTNKKGKLKCEELDLEKTHLIDEMEGKVAIDTDYMTMLSASWRLVFVLNEGELEKYSIKGEWL